MEDAKARLCVQYVRSGMQMKQASTGSCRLFRFLSLDPDREYRKGVHWLETLRLRRTKILESGYKVSFAYAVKVIRSLNVGQSLEMFVEELSVMMKSVLEKYADNMT